MLNKIKIRLNKDYIIIFLIALFLMTPVMISNVVHGHDYTFHVSNIFCYDNSLALTLSKLRLLPSKIIPIAANNFGYGTGIFYPNLAHWVTVYLYNIIKIFINNLPICMEITKGLVLNFSGISMYILMQRIFNNRYLSLISSISYMCAPYFFTDLYIRCAYAEMFTFIFIPLTFLGIYELLYGYKKRFYIFFTLGMTGMIYSHLVLTIYFIIFLFIILLLNINKLFKEKNIIKLIISSIFILIFSSPFLIPMLEHKINGNYVVFSKNSMVTNEKLVNASVEISDLFIQQSGPESIGYNKLYLNYITVFLVIFSLYSYKNYKSIKNIKSILLTVGIFTILSLIMSSAYFPWKLMPDILKLIQFPYRLLGFLSFGLSFFCSLFILQYKQDFQKSITPFILMLLIITGFQSISYSFIGRFKIRC